MHPPNVKLIINLTTKDITNNLYEMLQNAFKSNGCYAAFAIKIDIFRRG